MLTEKKSMVQIVKHLKNCQLTILMISDIVFQMAVMIVMCILR